MGEKTYTFRHHKWMVANKDFNLKELEENLIEDALSKGYIPRYVKSQYVEANVTYKGFPVLDQFRPLDKQTYALAQCHCAYAGKKMARIIWENNKDLRSPEMQQLQEVNRK